MRILATPPSLDRFMAESQGVEVDKVLRISSLKATDNRGRYLPWEKVRFLPPPDGLTAEEHWFGIKMARARERNPTPFVAKNGQIFTFVEPDVIRRGLHAIDNRAGGKIGIDQPVIDEANRDRYLVSSLIEEPFSSSVLEGAATTRQAAKEMVRDGRLPMDRDEQMVLNNYRALQFIQGVRNNPLTPQIVMELHRIITDKTLDDPSGVGEFRRPTDPVTVVDDITGDIYHVPPHADDLPERLQRICDFANASDDGVVFIHPTLKAIILHFMIGYDHPFVDGNGRTARALFYWYMISHGYWLIEFVSISKILNRAPGQYGVAYLNSEIDDNDLTYFLIHQLDVIRQSVDSLHEYLLKKAKERQSVESLLSDTAYDGVFNHRQLKLIQHALSHSGARYTIQQHLALHRVSYLTARKDLESLADRKLLRKSKDWRTSVYDAPDDLADRLVGTRS